MDAANSYRSKAFSSESALVEPARAAGTGGYIGAFSPQIGSKTTGADLVSDEEALAHPLRAPRPQRRYLSKVAKICEQCGESYFPRTDRVKTSRFCGEHCRNVAGGVGATKRDQRGELNANWKGGVSTDNSRYVKRRDPVHVAARNAVRNAIRSGKLVPQPCELEACGALLVHAHHPDHSKPLEVVWLCRDHHSFAHGGRGVGRGGHYVRVQEAA